MARAKQTARKRTGPKGVPRGRLAGRRSEYLAQFAGLQGKATSSQPQAQDSSDAWRERKEVEIRALNQEVRELDEARKKDRRRIRKLKKKLLDSEECKELWRSMLDMVYDSFVIADKLLNDHQLYPPQAPGVRAEEAGV